MGFVVHKAIGQKYNKPAGLAEKVDCCLGAGAGKEEIDNKEEIFDNRSERGSFKRKR